MSFFGRRDDGYEEEERVTETETYSTDYDRGGYQGYGRGNPSSTPPRDLPPSADSTLTAGPRDDERVEETTTTYYEDDNRPQPPNVSYPWRPEWRMDERRYIFVNDRTGERQWDFPGRGDYVSETTTTTTYENDDRRGYGGRDERYESQNTYVDEDERRRRNHHYGAMGAGGLAAGGLVYEGTEMFERDKYRVEDGVEDFPENAARWTGRKVQEVEDIPEVSSPPTAMFT